MENDTFISKIADEVRAKLEGERSGHDWWHTYRVWKMAKRIGEKEHADLAIVELAALLHDIADWKFHDGDEAAGSRVAGEMLKAQGVSEDTIARIGEIIQEVSFKGIGAVRVPSTLEGKVVQDADRLDGIGAIGIARNFAYAGCKNRAMHDPDIKPDLHQTKEAYVKNQSSAINHFYEKSLLLKDLMNTEMAKELAEGRHRFMEEYLDRFYEEWDGEM